MRGELVSFFDIIIVINGNRLDTESDVFMRVIASHVDTVVTLSVFNCKAGRMREVKIVPRNWSGSGLLGMHICFDSYEGTRQRVIHVVEVIDDSPAYLAGLQPQDDYIVGARGATFETVDEFSAFTQAHMNDEVTLYVYSRSRDSVREISIFMADVQWGDGKSGLGCVLASGLIHQLPNTDSLGFNDFTALRLQQDEQRDSSRYSTSAPQPASTSTPAVTSAPQPTQDSNPRSTSPVTAPSTAPATPVQPIRPPNTKSAGSQSSSTADVSTPVAGTMGYSVHAADLLREYNKSLSDVSLDSPTRAAEDEQ